MKHTFHFVLLSPFIFLSSHCIAVYYCDQTNGVKECDVGAWLQWNSCTNSCGGGSAKRFRKLCCSPSYKSYNQCALKCNKTISSLHRERTCSQSCIHGNFNISQNSCQCDGNYTGDCCQTMKVDIFTSGSKNGKAWKIPLICVAVIAVCVGIGGLIWFLVKRYKKNLNNDSIHPSEEMDN